MSKKTEHDDYLKDVAKALNSPSPFLAFQTLEIEHGRSGELGDNLGDRVGPVKQGYYDECPFCWHHGVFITKMIGTEGPDKGKPVYRAVCQRIACGAAGPERKTPKAALKAWNRRGLANVPRYRVLWRACVEIAKLRFLLNKKMPKTKRTVRESQNELIRWTHQRGADKRLGRG